MKNMKRIRKVVIKKMYDTDADSSNLGEYGNRPTNDHSIDRHHSSDCPRFWANDDIPDDARECDCGGYDTRSYQYFNGPVENYAGADRDEIRTYILQDYERMESLNSGDWHYIGISAEAQIQLQEHGVIQTITSGGLWGTESDSKPEYLAELGQEQLGELREQLYAVGFSKRAIATAFKDVEYRQE